MLNQKPLHVHFDSDVSSKVVRHVCAQTTERQREYVKYFDISPEKQFKIHDKCLILSKKHAFSKMSPIFYPTFEEKTYVVQEIDKRFLPWTYKLSTENSTVIKKNLYAIQMKKVTANAPLNLTQSQTKLVVPISQKNNDQNSGNANLIHVHDIIKQNPSRLRSGTVISGKENIFYRVTMGNKNEILPVSGLKLFKKAFGQNSITYSKIFQLPENSQYKI